MYVWCWSPETFASTVPSPHDIVYVPVAPPAGMVMFSPTVSTRQVVTNGISSACTAAPPAHSGNIATARASNSADRMRTPTIPCIVCCMRGDWSALVQTRRLAGVSTAEGWAAYHTVRPFIARHRCIILKSFRLTVYVLLYTIGVVFLYCFGIYFVRKCLQHLTIFDVQ